MASNTPILGQWRSYLEQVVPGDASEVQRVETKRAFFAGALAVWTVLMSDLNHGTPNDTPEDLRLMDAIQAELVAFGESGGTT